MALYHFHVEQIKRMRGARLLPVSLIVPERNCIILGMENPTIIPGKAA